MASSTRSGVWVTKRPRACNGPIHAAVGVMSTMSRDIVSDVRNDDF